MARGRGRRGPDRAVEPVRDGFAPGGGAVGHVTGGGTASWRGLGVGLRRWGWGRGRGRGRSVSVSGSRPTGGVDLDRPVPSGRRFPLPFLFGQD